MPGFHRLTVAENGHMKIVLVLVLTENSSILGYFMGIDQP